MWGPDASTQNGEHKTIILLCDTHDQKSHYKIRRQGEEKWQGG